MNEWTELIEALGRFRNTALLIVALAICAVVLIVCNQAVFPLAALVILRSPLRGRRAGRIEREAQAPRGAEAARMRPVGGRGKQHTRWRLSATARHRGCGGGAKPPPHQGQRGHAAQDAGRGRPT